MGGEGKFVQIVTERDGSRRGWSRGSVMTYLLYYADYSRIISGFLNADELFSRKEFMFFFWALICICIEKERGIYQ